MRGRSALAAALCAVVLIGPACRKRAPAAPPPPAFQPPPPITPAPVPMEEPAAVEKQQTPAELPKPPVPSVTEQLPPPPRPARPRRPAPRPAPAKPEEAAPAPQPAETAPAAPRPRLGEVLPGDAAAQYARQLEADMAAARQVLNALRGRRLSREQTDLANRIRTFLQQAERIRPRDLAAAAELGRRAALLAQELQRTLR